MQEDIRKVGRIGEETALNFIARQFKPEMIMQLDWMFKMKGRYYLVEVKHQEVYKAPPFDGHGLPPRQVKARLEFYKDTGIRPILMVIEKPKKAIYIQYLDVLNEDGGNWFDTRGKKQRRIYRLSKFIDFTNEAKARKVIS